MSLQSNPQRKGAGKGGQLSSIQNPFAKTAIRSRAPGLSGTMLLAAVLDEVLANGCAIMLGHTRDGGALCITVLDGEQRHRTYCTSEEELDEAMTALHNMYNLD